MGVIGVDGGCIGILGYLVECDCVYGLFDFFYD